MRRIQVIIREVADATSDQATELATFDLPATDVAALQPETALDQLATTTHTVGTQILQRLLQAQWDVVDASLIAAERRRLSPPCPSWPTGTPT
ncbi:MAG: hypothetical protein HXY37_06880 [Chloroflexi bacterium]|nr:hypothetical protein [Chloroflexota bacterium]